MYKWIDKEKWGVKEEQDWEKKRAIKKIEEWRHEEIDRDRENLEWSDAEIEMEEYGDDGRTDEIKEGRNGEV